jgi:hypothetical protein
MAHGARQRDRRRGGGRQQRKSQKRRQQRIELICGIEAGEDCRATGGGERLRDVGGARSLAFWRRIAAHDPFGGARQEEAESDPEHDADGRCQPAVIDRQFDEERAAQGQRDPAEPDQPILDNQLFEPPTVTDGCRARNWCRGRRRFRHRGGFSGRLLRLGDRLLRLRRGHVGGRHLRRGHRPGGLQPLVEAQQAILQQVHFLPEIPECVRRPAAAEHRLYGDGKAGEKPDPQPREPTLCVQSSLL